MGRRERLTRGASRRPARESEGDCRRTDARVVRLPGRRLPRSRLAGLTTYPTALALAIDFGLRAGGTVDQPTWADTFLRTHSLILAARPDQADQSFGREAPRHAARLDRASHDATCKGWIAGLGTAVNLLRGLESPSFGVDHDGRSCGSVVCCGKSEQADSRYTKGGSHPRHAQRRCPLRARRQRPDLRTRRPRSDLRGAGPRSDLRGVASRSNLMRCRPRPRPSRPPRSDCR
jgi:hypothetical protein